MDTGLSGRVVVITGASEGMARAAANGFAIEGAKLAICSRREAKIKRAADEITNAFGTEVHAEAVDVTDHAALSRFISAAAKKFGRIDACVANAGGPPPKPFFEATDADWQKAIETNLLSVVALAREVLPHMQKHKWGRFVTITSTSVRQPIPDLLLSSSVRPAVVGFIKTMAINYGPDGITFNNVAPGYTATERLNEVTSHRAQAAGTTEEEIRRRWEAEIPLRRLGRPEDIADAIVWLCSERASYITGQTLLVDGGIYRGL